MCGIVGLHLKAPDLYPRLGELLVPMLDSMASRGPDSAGLALYHEPEGQQIRYSLRADEAIDWEGLRTNLESALGNPVGLESFGDRAIATTPSDQDALLAALGQSTTDVVLEGHGRALEVFKDVGAPGRICVRFGIGKRTGFTGVGHTRMATESAVTVDHSHPFVPAADLSLVHNGSFSNHATVRRQLARRGIHCVTDNDSEVAARYVSMQIDGGADLGEALRMVHKELDGFFTLLVSTMTQFAVLRDSFACKPAVIAETDRYVAVASEYHALAGLPSIGDAVVFEPEPEVVYTWDR